MKDNLRRSMVPFLLRGFLRFLVLATPLFVLFTVLSSDDRRVTWVDTETSFRDIVGDTIPWLVVALIVLTIAEAFDIGLSLADDIDGLV